VTGSSITVFTAGSEIWQSFISKRNSWFYQLPLPVRSEEAEAAVALLPLAEGLARPLSGMADAGGDHAGADGNVISQVRMPQSIANLRQMMVDAHRRDRVLVVKCNEDFRIVGCLEIADSAVRRLVVRAKALAVPPMSQVQVLQLTLDASEAVGFRVRVVPTEEWRQLLVRDLEAPPSACACIGDRSGQ
jgi:hypothetical protein